MEGEPVEGDIPSHLDRRALIVYTGKFNSVDGPVEVDDKQLALLQSTHNSFLTRLTQALGGAQIPVRMNPPLQLDHSTSAKDTVGRLVGPVEIAPHKLSDGTEVQGLFGGVRILGKENVEKYLDGRYSNVSIGADFKTGKISELTITPFPAAEEATLMTAATQSTQGESMKQHLEGMKHHFAGLAHHMAHYMEPAQQQEHMASIEGLGKHMTEVGPATQQMGGMPEPFKKHFEMVGKHFEGMKGKKFEKHHLEGMKHHMDGLAHHLAGVEVGPNSDGPTSMKHHLEGMKKHLEGMSTEAAPPSSPVPAKMDSGQTPAVDEKKPEHMAAKLSEGIKRLAELNAKMVLATKKNSLSSRLNSIKRLGKITPAEMAKIDLTKLASETDATQNAVLKSYEDREPVIMAGMVGNAKAEDVATLSKELRIQRMMKEARENMPLKKAEMDHKLAGNQNGSRLAGDPGENEVNIHVDAVPGGEHDTDMKKMEEEVNKLMEEGKVPEAKEKLKAYMEAMKKKHMAAPEAHDDAHKEMSALAEEAKTLQNDLSSLVRLAGA